LALTALKLRPGREHQPLLRAGDRDVDAPLVVAVVDGPERGDGVDEQEGGVVGRVHGLAHLADPAGDAGRGLVVDDAHGLDARLGVGGQPLLHHGRVDAVAPVAGHDLDVEAQRAAMCSHSLAKCPVSKNRTCRRG
jgi:hypothetical protein